MVRPAALALVTALAVVPQTATRIDAPAAGQHIGQTMRVCGPVAGRRGGVPREKAATQLDLVAAFPAQAITVTISAKARRNIVEQFEERSDRLDLCAQGKIDKTSDGLELKVDEAHLLVGVTRRPAEPFHANLLRPGQMSQEGLVGPEVLKSVNPKYTDAAKKARIEGMVHIEAVILEDGSVGDTRVIKSIDALLGLDDEAMKAFKQWRFRPATRSGQPTRVVVVGILRFDLFL